MKKITIILLAALILLPGSAYAAGLCCQLSGGVQEGLPGVASPEPRKLSLKFSYSFTLMDRLREGTMKNSLQEVIDEGRYMSIPSRSGFPALINV